MKTLNSGTFVQVSTIFFKAFGLVAVLAFYDAVFGAGISGGLWPSRIREQAVLDIWQASFGCAVFFVLYLAYTKNSLTAFSALILLVGYVEDSLYYAFLPITKHIVYFLSSGNIVVSPEFHEQIPGWVGWVLRFFNAWPGFGISIPLVSVINIASIALVLIILFVYKEKKS